jgi:NUDIX domain
VSDVEKYCPESLWHLVQPLLPAHPERHQGGGRRRTSREPCVYPIAVRKRPKKLEAAEVDDDDIAWTAEAGSFKYRSAAAIRHGDRLLVCAVEHIDGWFLPGGKVHFGEGSAAALERELREELKLEVSVTSAPLLITEGIRDHGGVLHKEVCFYYAVSWPDEAPSDSVDDLIGHRFRLGSLR